MATTQQAEEMTLFLTQLLQNAALLPDPSTAYDDTVEAVRLKLEELNEPV